MLQVNEKDASFVMTNAALTAEVLYATGEILEFSNSLCAKKQNCRRELFILKIYDHTYSSRDFTFSSISFGEDATEELVSLQYELEREKITVRIHFLNDRQDTIRVIYQVRDDYKLGVPCNSRMKIPLLAELEVNGPGDRFYAPGNPAISSKGAPVIMPMRDYEYSSDIRLPLVLCDSEDRLGFMVRFPSLSDLNDDGANQNAGKGLSMVETEGQIRDDFFRINPDASFNDTVEAVFTGIRNGWAEAFDRYRSIWASAYDFSEYQKEDLQWFQNCVINNFTFLFGKEGFDHENQRIDVEGLMKQGEEFGGYDTVTIWNQYPRLGIDARSQWDFYDDFPGGRAALGKAVEEFHKKGARVFLPYIPWDRGSRESTETMGDEFARIIADTGADGFQLDTMHDIPPSFRQKLNALRPGIVLTSQAHPSKGLPIELVTTSWDEFWRIDPMPELDILRFICPRHLAPVISRWLRSEDKTTLINRAMFGAAPMVIWQDIFGRWMPFSAEQKATLGEYKAVYLKYRPIYQGSKPIPLYPILSDRNLYCNLFSGDQQEGEIYSFYNDSAEEITARGIRLNNPAHRNAELILAPAGTEAPAIEQGALTVRVPPHRVVHVLTG